MKNETYKASHDLLDRFEHLINARLKRCRPRQYRKLMESGNLIEHLKQQAKLAVSLMGASVDAGADESSALEFAWQLLYPEPEKSPPEQNSLSDFISFDYEWAASLLLLASQRKGSPIKIEQALHTASLELAEKRCIAKDEAAAWVLGRTALYYERNADKPKTRVKDVLSFLAERMYEEEPTWDLSHR